MISDDLKRLIRSTDCNPCQFEDTHDGDSCYMFADRGDCYVKRPARSPNKPVEQTAEKTPQLT